MITAEDLVVGLRSPGQTPAEVRFKYKVVCVVTAGTYPSPNALTGTKCLNGRQCRWREEALTALGWQRAPRRGGKPRWYKPYADLRKERP